jgi:hypothetical protein
MYLFTIKEKTYWREGTPLPLRLRLLHVVKVAQEKPGEKMSGGFSV